MEARDQMHTITDTDEETKTDSQKMFDMGLKGVNPYPSAEFSPNGSIKERNDSERAQRLSGYPRFLRRWRREPEIGVATG